MHGPTCIFRANLTPFSLKDLRLRRANVTLATSGHTVTPAVGGKGVLLLRVPQRTLGEKEPHAAK
jgi:hypothetical protein